MVSNTRTSTTSTDRPKGRMTPQSNSAQPRSPSHQMQQRTRKRGWLWFGLHKVSS